MITGPLKSKIDKLWTEFWSGGITNPISVIEQISFLMFARLLDINEAKTEKKAQRVPAAKKELLFGPDEQHIRWSSFRHESSPDKLLKIVRDELFPFLEKELPKRSALGNYLKGAQCLIAKPSLLVTAVNLIDELPLARADTKGDLYEYMLGKLSTAGIAGQFRTPRHIIQAMVRMLNPKPTEVVGDPACGTAGFLVETMNHLLETYSTPELVHTDEDGVTHHPGDQLEPFRKHIQNGMFHGFDFDQTMLRIAAMNLLLHGVDSPCINYQDTLAGSFADRYPKESGDFFDVILANPPFKGSIDAENIEANLKSKVKTTKTELLFLILMLRMLKMGGRCAVIVPDGVLFGSSKAHTIVRKLLVEQNQLEAVISLPSGVFKPYAGVSTAILLFTKGGRTDDVWFYKVERDGFSLDDKRTELPKDQNDLPDLLTQWQARNPKKKSDRTAQHFFVPLREIEGNKFDLSVNRYREARHEEVAHDPPKVILKNLKKMERDIQQGLEQLDGMLK